MTSPRNALAQALESSSHEYSRTWWNTAGNVLDALDEAGYTIVAKPTGKMCAACAKSMHWIECPTGGWWAHDVHPDDDHDAIYASTVDPDDPETVQLVARELMDGPYTWLQPHQAQRIALNVLAALRDGGR